MRYEMHFIRERYEQIRREVNSLRLGEQLRKNRKPHVWRLAGLSELANRLSWRSAWR
jgi:hypothetical protein